MEGEKRTKFSIGPLGCGGDEQLQLPELAKDYLVGLFC